MMGCRAVAIAYLSVTNTFAMQTFLQNLCRGHYELGIDAPQAT
jgi:hypothetical protein